MIYMYTTVRLTADFSSDMIAVGRQWDNMISLLEVKTQPRILSPANYLSEMKVGKDILR